MKLQTKEQTSSQLLPMTNCAYFISAAYLWWVMITEPYTYSSISNIANQFQIYQLMTSIWQLQCSLMLIYLCVCSHMDEQYLQYDERYTSLSKCVLVKHEIQTEKSLTNYTYWCLSMPTSSVCKLIKHTLYVVYWVQERQKQKHNSMCTTLLNSIPYAVCNWVLN